MSATGALTNWASGSEHIDGLMGPLRNSGKQLQEFTSGLFAEMRSTILSQAEELLSMRQQLDDREMQLEEERIARAAESKRMEMLRSRIDEVEAQTAAKEELNDETRELLDDLISQRDQLRREFANAVSQRRKLEAEMEQLRSALDQAHQDMASLDAARVAAAMMPAENEDSDIDALRKQVRQVQQDIARRRGEEAK